MPNYGLNRYCYFCKEIVPPWSRRNPEWCCEEYRESVQEAQRIALLPPPPKKKKPHPFTGRRGPL